MNRFSKAHSFRIAILPLLAIALASGAAAKAAPQDAAAPASPAPTGGSSNAPQPSGPNGQRRAESPSGFGMGRLPPDAKAVAAPRTMAPYFMPATKGPKAPGTDGFLQRWLILEPINKPNRTNTVFTDTYVRKTLNTEYFPDQMTAVPKAGSKVTVADQQLTWHAVDATSFDAKLFNFAYGLNKQTYGVIFWAVTVVNSPRERKDVRLAVGSNSASMWWLNGSDVVDLFNDRRMVMDDVISKPLTLKKGKNILRGAVINGPGLSDFCVRFVDENGNPIKDITTSLE